MDLLRDPLAGDVGTWQRDDEMPEARAMNVALFLDDVTEFNGKNWFDRAGNYQYKAFGVPGLGLARGLADELVVAPYASALALMVDAESACRNLRQHIHTQKSQNILSIRLPVIHWRRHLRWRACLVSQA